MIGGNNLQPLRDVSIHSLLGISNQGRRVMMRCPFHKDRTASFCLYPDNSFHCFGCKAHGSNAIDFVLLVNGNDFSDAKQYLSKFA